MFADDVEDARNTLEQLATSQGEPTRVVALSWREIPPLGNELGLLVDALGNATLQSFPSLYGGLQAPRERWSNADLEQAAHDITRRLPDVQGAVCREILASCMRGRVPIVKRLPNPELVRQLALAIEPWRLVVLIAAAGAGTDDPRLRALAQGAEWLAANTNGRVVVLLPTAFARAPELDHLSYAACLFLGAGAASRPAARDRAPGADRVAAQRGRPAPPDLYVSPLLGQPHPRSEAENELHRYLSADPELHPLFTYNQPVETRYDTRPIVDLLWREGRLVIEIDGSDHRGERKFAQDRRRDYELLLSGYRVVRFTSARVLEETKAVVEQIRDVVRHLDNLETK